MDQWNIEVAKNVAANGRAFCLMIFAASIAAFVTGYGSAFGRYAILCALPVGASCILDQLPNNRLRMIAAALIYGFSALMAFIVFIEIG